MPATAGTLEYVQTSELNAVQLRGVDATALRTGDLAFLTSTKQYYYLDKASMAADDGVNVITTKGAVTTPFPLGDPAIPGRWILGPCVPCGTGVTLPDVNPGFAELAVDASTDNLNLLELLGVAVLTGGGTSLEIQADTSGDNTQANDGGDFVVAVDGINIRGFGWTTSASDRIESGGITIKIAVPVPGFHHVALLWAPRAAGSVRIQPVTRPRSDHASLFVREVNT
jgi:hypothetical protein